MLEEGVGGGCGQRKVNRPGYRVESQGYGRRWQGDHGQLERRCENSGFYSKTRNHGECHDLTYVLTASLESLG